MDRKTPTSRDTGLRCQLTFVSDVPSKASSSARDLALARANRSLQASDRCVRLPSADHGLSTAWVDTPELRAPLGDVPRVGPACVLADTAVDRVAGGTVLCVEDVGSIS